MSFYAFALGVAAVFFVSSLIMLNWGRSIGLQSLHHQHPDDIAALSTVENAVFALIGLLLAFTISGALQRFDERRQQIVQEATAVSSAYDRLDLFEHEVAHKLQAGLKAYVQARLELFRMRRHFSPWQYETVYSDQQEDKVLERKDKLWEAAIAACPNSTPLACAQALPTLASVFEVARLRAGAIEKHPPEVIYVMLFGLGLGGSLLGGFGMARAKAPSWIHMVTFAGALTIVLYVITDMEFPRMGFIRLDYFDHYLTDVYEQMR